MATTLTLFETSPYSLKYRIANDDSDSGGGSASKTQAQMFADAIGALRGLLGKTYTSGQWAALIGTTTPGTAQVRCPLSVHVAPSPNPDANAAPAIGAILTNNDAANILFATCGVSGSGTVSGIIEIRMHQSSVR